jgi:hypothetical protein
LGYEISSGQMDMKLAMKVDNGAISGEANMLLRGIDMEAANAAASITKNTEMISLNAAISLLKDRNGNVALDVPLYGDIDSPSFGWSGFIAIIAKRAIAEAASTYLIRTFIPYANVVSVVKYASDRVLKTQFEPQEYTATQTKVDPKQENFIKQFRASLLDRKDGYVKMCPIAVPGDLQLPEGTKVLTKIQQDALETIARQRGQALKDKILEDTSIASSRVFLCAPTIDTQPAAKPRIEFDFW